MKRLLFLILALGTMLGGTAADLSPRLLFTDRNVARLKTPEGRAQAAALADQAKKNRIEAWSLVYRVTGDRKYAEKVRAALLKDCVRSSRPWPNGLNGAHRCYEMALGYDSIRDFLSPEERRAIASGIVARGIEPMLGEWLFGKTRTTTLDSMGHNWWSACVFLPGFAALAVVDEEPRMLPVLERIKEATKEWFDYPGSVLNNKPVTFDRAGGFYEGGIFATALILAAEMFLSKLEYRMLDNAPEVNLYMEYSNKACLDNVLKLFRDLELKVLNMEITRSTETETHNACALFTLRLNKRCRVEQLIPKMNATEGVVSVEEL